MNKKKSFAFGKDIYLLGRDKYGTFYWLEAPSWNCGWYWGFGYVETYTNNRSPKNSKDISSHSHFDGLMKENYLVETTFNKKELYPLFEEFYRLKETKNDHIDKVVLPELFERILNILKP